MNKILTESDSKTEPFSFSGECYICAKGSGQIRILREMGGSYEIVTDENGDPLVFTDGGDGGVIFNSHINCTARINHIIEAVTTESIKVLIVRGK